MHIASIISFALAAALLVMSPGPNAFLILKTVPTAGRYSGFVNIAGFVVAFYLHGVLSILGISVILVHASEVFFVVKMLGAAYLAWIGIKALRDAWKGTAFIVEYEELKSKKNTLIAFREGFLTNALNPKVSLFYLAVVPQFIPTDGNTVQYGLMLVTVHALISATWFSMLVLLLNRFKHFLQKRSFQRGIKAITGVLFLGFSGKLATYKP